MKTVYGHQINTFSKQQLETNGVSTCLFGVYPNTVQFVTVNVFILWLQRTNNVTHVLLELSLPGLSTWLSNSRITCVFIRFSMVFGAVWAKYQLRWPYFGVGVSKYCGISYSSSRPTR